MSVISIVLFTHVAMALTVMIVLCFLDDDMTIPDVIYTGATWPVFLWRCAAAGLRKS